MHVFHLTWQAFSDWNLQRAQKSTCVSTESVVVEDAANGFGGVHCERFFTVTKTWHRRCSGWTWTYSQWFCVGALWKVFSDQNLQKSTNTYLGVGIEGAVVEDASNGFVGVLRSLLLAHRWSHGVNGLMNEPANVHSCCTQSLLEENSVRYTSTKSMNELANVFICLLSLCWNNLCKLHKHQVWEWTSKCMSLCPVYARRKKKSATQALSLWMNLQMYAAAVLSMLEESVSATQALSLVPRTFLLFFLSTQPIAQVVL